MDPRAGADPVGQPDMDMVEHLVTSSRLVEAFSVLGRFLSLRNARYGIDAEALRPVSSVREVPRSASSNSPGKVADDELPCL